MTPWPPDPAGWALDHHPLLEADAGPEEGDQVRPVDRNATCSAPPRRVSVGNGHPGVPAARGRLSSCGWGGTACTARTPIGPKLRTCLVGEAPDPAPATYSVPPCQPAAVLNGPRQGGYEPRCARSILVSRPRKSLGFGLSRPAMCAPHSRRCAP
jgi:hypothetical protein